MGTVSKEKAAYLWNELTEYEKHTKMTAMERAALHEWVLEGYSVHENGSMASTESGEPCDFLDVYRYEEELRQDLKKLSTREQENYLARLRNEDTIDNLREDFNELFFKAEIYEQVLQIYGLLEEAKIKIENAKEESRERAKQFDEWLAAHPDAELPFN